MARQQKNRTIAQNVRNSLPVPMRQKIPENSPVAPSYGQNSHFGPPIGPQKKSLSPPDPPKTSKSQIAAAGGRTIGSRESTKVAQCERASDEPKIPQKLPGGAELRPKTCPKEAGLGFGPVLGQLWPNSDRFWPTRQKSINSSKCAQRSPGSNEPKFSRKLPGGAELRPKHCQSGGG